MRQTPEKMRAYLALLRKKMNLKSLVVALAAIVVFTTTYLLILPAFTLDKEEAAQQGGIDVVAEETAAMEASDAQDEEEPVVDTEEVTDEDQPAADTEEAKDEEPAPVSKDTEKAEAGSDSNSDSGSDVKVLTKSAGLEAEGDGFTITASPTGKEEVPATTELLVSEVEKNRELAVFRKEALSALQEDSNDVTDIKEIKVYDMSLEADGESVNTDSKFNVKIEYEDGVKVEDADNLRVLTFDDKNKASVLDADENKVETKVEAAGEKSNVTEASFETEGISKVAVVEVETIEKTVITADGKTYKVTVKYGKDAEIPAGATLDVKELTGDDYDAYLEKTASKLDKSADDLGMAKFFDITIKNGNDEVKIAAPVDVEIKLLDSDNLADSTQVLHFENENKADVVDSKVNGDTVKFKAEGFSVYAVVGEGDEGDYARMTVEFYNGETKIASMIVKNSDTADEIEHILYDPGAGNMESGELFKGWIMGDPNNSYAMPAYTTDDVDQAMTIHDIREWAESRTITEHEVVKFYAMKFRTFAVSFKDEDVSLIHSEALITGGDYVDYLVNQEYTPKSEDAKFEGWYWEPLDSGSNAKVSTTSGVEIAQNTPIPNGTTVRISGGSIVFRPNPADGYWLSFIENGTGASYTPPQFIKEGESTSEPPAPTRLGYTFGGWYTGAPATTGGEPTGTQFTFGGTISSRVTLYAKWAPNATAKYRVLIWKQNVDATGYDFEESIEIEGATGTNISTVTQQGTGDSAYARVNGVNKQYEGFHLKEFDQNVPIKAEGNATLNVYYDRNEYTLRFFYARTYNYNNRTYVQVNCNNEGFLQGRRNNRNLNNSLTYRSNSGDYRRVSGTNTWKDVNNDSINGNPVNLVSAEYLAKDEVSAGTLSISNVSTDVYTISYGYRNRNNRTVNTTYYYLDVKARYEQSLDDLWPVPNTTFVSQTMTNYNDADDTGNYTTISPLLQGSWATGNNIGGKYSTMNSELFANNDSTAYFLTYWRFENHYNYNYNVYFSAMDGETPTTTYKGNGYVLQNDKSYVVANGQGWGNGAPTDSGSGYWDVGTVTFDGTDVAGRVDVNNGNINVYYDRKIFNVNYYDGLYVNGNGVELHNESTYKYSDDVIEEQTGSDTKEYYQQDVSAYNEGGSKYFTPTPQHDGYIFDGWYIDDACTQPYTFTTMPQKDITVYAKWVQKQYRVFLHPNVPTSDTSLEWAQEGQSTSFRVNYGEKVSGGNKIIGTRDGYEIIGWYTDPECTNSFNFDAYTLRDDTKDVLGNDLLIPYDQTQNTELDEYGNPSETGNKDSANNRFWVTKKLELYAKWRAVIVGAPGISVEYDAVLGKGTFPTGSTTYTDPLTYYLDRAEATAAAASNATSDDEQFLHWVVQKWDATQNKYVDAKDDNGEDVIVYPGDTFEVLKAYAKEENIPEQQATDSQYKKYTVRLRAEYGQKQAPTPTHIYWYANSDSEPGANPGTNKDYMVKTYEEINGQQSEFLEINKGFPIMPADTFEYEGHEFLGWARIAEPESGYDQGNYVRPDVEKLKNTTLDDADLYLKYDKTTGKFQAYIKDNDGKWAWTDVTEVAADEKQPYHDMFAVWGVKKFNVDITKEVSGSDADKAQSRTYEISYRYQNASGEEVSGSVNLYHQQTTSTAEGQPQTITGVPYGTIITVTEEGEADFDKSYSATHKVEPEGQDEQQDQAFDPEEESDGGAVRNRFKVTSDTTIKVTNTRKSQLVMVKKTNMAGDVLEGAEFTLNGITYTSGSDGFLKENGETKVFKLDMGSHNLSESNPPEGYKKLQGNVVISVEAQKVGASIEGTVTDLDCEKDETGIWTVTVINSSGEELPMTGGIGTTIFYIFGSILAIGCGIVLVSRKRLGSKK